MCFFVTCGKAFQLLFQKRIKDGAVLQLSFPSVDGETGDTADRFPLHLSAIESYENPVTFEA